MKHDLISSFYKGYKLQEMEKNVFATIAELVREAVLQCR